MRASRRGIQLSLPTGTQTMMPSETNQMSALINTPRILKRLAHQQLTHQPGPQSRREKTANVSQIKLPGRPISNTPLCIKLHILHNVFRRKTALKGKRNNDLRSAKCPGTFCAPCMHTASHAQLRVPASPRLRVIPRCPNTAPHARFHPPSQPQITTAQQTLAPSHDTAKIFWMGRGVTLDIGDR
jgi:hypothetical protein